MADQRRRDREGGYVRKGAFSLINALFRDVSFSTFPRGGKRRREAKKDDDVFSSFSSRSGGRKPVWFCRFRASSRAIVHRLQTIIKKCETERSSAGWKVGEKTCAVVLPGALNGASSLSFLSAFLFCFLSYLQVLSLYLLFFAAFSLHAFILLPLWLVIVCFSYESATSDTSLPSEARRPLSRCTCSCPPALCI